MGKLDMYDEQEKKQITALMCRLVEEGIESGAIEESSDAIKAAMPQAMADAKTLFNAAIEYLSG